jgi:hypothetical protein
LPHIKVSVPQNQAFVVACKNEGFRNQVGQWEGNNLIFRVPTYLEFNFCKYVESKMGDLPRHINRLPVLATTCQCPIVCENKIFDGKIKINRRMRQKVCSDACWLG